MFLQTKISKCHVDIIEFEHFAGGGYFNSYASYITQKKIKVGNDSVISPQVQNNAN